MSVKPLKAYEKLKGVVELVDKQLEMMKAAEPVPDVVLIVLPNRWRMAARLSGHPS